jgi:PKD repeat protein
MNYHKMKKGILLLLAAICYLGVNGQTTITQNRSWVDVMLDPDSRFDEVQQAFYDEWQDRPYERGKGWKQFHRWENFWESRLMPDGSFPDFNDLFNEFKAFRSAEVQRGGPSSAGLWTPMGPFTHNATQSWSPGQGRVNVIVEDPSNSNTIYIGAPAGGIWRSIDNGSNWTPLGDEIAVIGISGIAVDHNDGNTIYISTGDADGGDTYSIGVLKSTDGGTTWNSTGTINANSTNKILIDPTNSSIVWVATSNGIYKSTNGGTSWNNVLNVNISDMALKPGDPQTVYGVTATDFYYSTDGGGSFNTASGLPASSGRLAIGVTAANNSYVYVLSAATNWGFQGLYRSTNSGVSFSPRNTTTDIFESNQAWFDMAISVSQTNANTVVTGVLNAWRSTNGGTSFSQLNDWNNPGGQGYTHADIHYMSFIGNRLYCGSDGGIYRSTNNGTAFTSLTDGLQIGQFYRIGGSKTDASVIGGGLQDNGGYAWTNGTWKNYAGADGMESDVDPTDPDVIFGMIQYGSLYYTTNGGNNYNNVGSPEQGRWITPMQRDPNRDRIIAGYDDVHEWDYTTGWNQLSTFNFPAQVKNLDIYDGNSDIMYVSTNQSIFRTNNDGGAFTDVTNNLSTWAPAGLTSIEIHPTDPDQVWVSLGGNASGDKVIYTNDGGATWTNISGNLPNIPCHVVKYEAGSNGALYVGMDIGCYYTDNALGTWISFGNQLPNVIVNDLEINETSNIIRAGTYGRGVWESATYGASLQPDDAGISLINDPAGSICGTNILPEVVLTNYGINALTSVTINYDIDGGPNQTFNWVGSLTTNQTATITLPTMTTTSGAHVFNASTSNPNGNTDSNGANDASLSNFSAVANGVNVTLNLTLDCWGNETTWEIQDASTTVIESGGPYTQDTPDGAGIITDNWCLAAGCYDFIINDTYGDGMYGSQWGTCNVDGDYQIVDDATSNVLASLIAANADYGNQEINNFCVSTSSGVVADFVGTPTTVCAGSAVPFSNLSTGNPNTFQWTFQGGTPGSATAPNPLITYNTPGTYDVTLYVSDGVTNDTKVVTNYITVTSNPNVNATDTDITCNGDNDGSATASVGGGTSPYSYSWSPSGGTGSSASNLSAGTYTVTVTDANGCTGDDNVIITEPAVLTVSTTVTNANCGQSDGTATAVVSGGTTPYNYSWTSGGSSVTETGLNIGTYTVTVTDANGCSGSADAIIVNPNAPTAGGTMIDETCAADCDGVLNATATGGTPGYTYTWATLGTGANQTNVCAGTYTCTITDANGCTDVMVFTINAGPAYPVADFVFNPNDTVWVNTPVTFVNTTSGAGTTLWDFGDTQTSTQSSPTHTYTSPGTYTVLLLVDNGGCIDTISYQIVVLDPTGIADKESGAELSIFPNPNNGNFMLEISGLEGETFVLKVTDVRGRIISQEQLPGISGKFNRQVNMTEEADGLYFFEVIGNNGSVKKKMVKH